jgi:hypothetical protein
MKKTFYLFCTIFCILFLVSLCSCQNSDGKQTTAVNEVQENTQTTAEGEVQENTQNNEQLANEILSEAIKESEAIWNRKLDKPINFTIKTDGSETEKQEPTMWSGSKGSTYNLQMHKDFNLENTWWNMQPENSKLVSSLKDATIKQKYTLAISHEVTHLFMNPTPKNAWFQESVAMTVGKSIAEKMDPSLSGLFPEPTAEVSADDLFSYNYQKMIDSLDNCRALQLKAYSLSSKIPAEKLIGWVEGFRGNNMESETEDSVNDKLYNSMPK